MKSDFFQPNLELDFSSLPKNLIAKEKADDFYLFFLNSLKGLGQASIWHYLSTGKNRQKIKELIYRQGKNKVFLQETLAEFEKIQEPYLSILNKKYPSQLKNIYDPPLFLFYKGEIDLLSSAYIVTIVGSRSLDSYHITATQKIISALANTPLIIASGLALGIDALSHQGALNNDLKTIAVLGSGLDDSVLYPQHNLALAQKIITKGGLLLSEYSQNQSALLHHFPRRNRILAGLSKVTVIISGAKKSGALITAQVALDEGREVYALPGNINQRLSQAPNYLLQNGANILLEAQDILEAYQIKKEIISDKINFKEKLHAQIHSLLQTEPLTLVELAFKLQKPLPEINSAVSHLEISGLIKINQFNQIEIK